MPVTVERGKILSVRLGWGGNDDAMFGFSFALDGEGGWGAGDFWGTWRELIPGTGWTVKDSNRIFLESLLRVEKLMEDSRVDDFEKLKGIPIEATFDNNTLQSWRVLTEVL